VTGLVLPPGEVRVATAATRFDGRAMGSPLRLTLGGPAGSIAPSRAAAAWSTVVDEFERAEGAMSRFRDDSELTRLNRSAGTGMAVAISMRLRRALVAADRARRITGGRFDPRVLADLDRLGYRGASLGGAVLSADDLRAGTPARSGPHGRVVELVGRQRVAIGRPVDLGGIGKGLTLRWAAARLADLGVADLLLDAGGDLVARGRAPGGGPWQVAIEDPAGEAAPVAVIGVGGLAVATSSTRLHRWLFDGRSVHHLLDPRTGEPAQGGLASVSVAGPDPAWAEVWSKVLFLGGLSAIAAEARSRGLAAWWVAIDGTLAMTPAARAMTIWVAAEAG
jgi:thiamine biosynthesis lipoprotein